MGQGPPPGRDGLSDAVQSLAPAGPEVAPRRVAGGTAITAHFVTLSDKMLRRRGAVLSVLASVRRPARPVCSSAGHPPASAHCPPVGPHQPPEMWCLVLLAALASAAHGE